jgi:hypothetical protein
MLFLLHCNEGGIVANNKAREQEIRKNVWKTIVKTREKNEKVFHACNIVPKYLINSK